MLAQNGRGSSKNRSSLSIIDDLGVIPIINAGGTNNYRAKISFAVDQIAEIPRIIVNVEQDYDHYIAHAVVTFTENCKEAGYTKNADRMKVAAPRVYVVVDYRVLARKMWINPLNIQYDEVEIIG